MDFPEYPGYRTCSAGGQYVALLNRDADFLSELGELHSHIDEVVGLSRLAGLESRACWRAFKDWIAEHDGCAECLGDSPRHLTQLLESLQRFATRWHLPGDGGITSPVDSIIESWHRSRRPGRNNHEPAVYLPAPMTVPRWVPDYGERTVIALDKDGKAMMHAPAEALSEGLVRTWTFVAVPIPSTVTPPNLPPFEWDARFDSRESFDVYERALVKALQEGLRTQRDDKIAAAVASGYDPRSRLTSGITGIERNGSEEKLAKDASAFYEHHHPLHPRTVADLARDRLPDRGNGKSAAELNSRRDVRTRVKDFVELVRPLGIPSQRGMRPLAELRL